VTAIADLVDPVTRRRLLDRLDEINEIDRVMRRRGSLAAPAEPVPLHRVRQADDVIEETTGS
jgi:hypothetical protein